MTRIFFSRWKIWTTDKRRAIVSRAARVLMRVVLLYDRREVKFRPWVFAPATPVTTVDRREEGISEPEITDCKTSQRNCETFYTRFHFFDISLPSFFILFLTNGLLEMNLLLM